LSKIQVNRNATRVFVQTSAIVSAPLIFGVLFAAGLTLIAVTPIPAMTDYLNHLARMYLIFADRAGHASPYYEVRWAFYPNLAMDLFAPWLAQWLGVELASRLFVLLAQFLVVSGVVAIEVAVKKRFDYAGFVALLFFCSFPFAWGFVNFYFGFGVALLGIASWIALREKSAILRFAFHLAFFAVLLISHLLALGIYGFALGLHEIWRALRNRPSFGLFLRDGLVLATPAVIGAAVFVAKSGSVGQDINIWGFTSKFGWPLLAIDGYNVALSAVCLVISAMMIWRLKRENSLRFESSGVWQAWGFLALYLLIPQTLQRTAFVDVRIVVAAALIVPCFVSIRFPDERWRRNASLLVLTMIVANLAVMATVWNSYRADYRDIIASFSRLPKAPKILVAASGSESIFEMDDLLPMYHAPVLATYYNDALVSTTMAVKGKQPLSSRPDFERLNVHDDPPASISDLQAAAKGPESQIYEAYLRHWTRDFDFIYYIGRPIPNPMPELLQEMESRRRFTVYQIRKP
jgi:hypothetical protein